MGAQHAAPQLARTRTLHRLSSFRAGLYPAAVFLSAIPLRPPHLCVIFPLFFLILAFSSRFHIARPDAAPDAHAH